MSTRGKPPLPVSVNTRSYTIFGEKYPRVTSIIGCLPKPALVGWAAKAAATYAVNAREVWQGLPAADAIGLIKAAPFKERDEAGDRGDVIHRVIKSYLKGEPMPDCNEEGLDVAIAAEAFLLENKPEVLGTEITVFSPSLKYAGTCDFWGLIDGRLWLLDWKSSKGVYGDYAVQLGAYALAERAVINNEVVEWGPKYDARLGVVHLTAGGYKLYEVRLGLHRLSKIFTALQVVQEFCTQEQEDALVVSSTILPLDKGEICNQTV